MKYRVIGVQYYFYDVEADDEEEATIHFQAMMRHGTSSEIDRLKSQEVIAVNVVELEN